MRIWFVIAVYAAFIAAYHNLPLAIVGALWVLGAVVATIAILRSAPGDRPSWLDRWILFGGLLVWPIQLATLSASKEDDARSEASRKSADLFESAGMAEGARVTLTVDERKTDDGSVVIFVTDGSSTST